MQQLQFVVDHVIGSSSEQLERVLLLSVGRSFRKVKEVSGKEKGAFGGGTYDLWEDIQEEKARQYKEKTGMDMRGQKDGKKIVLTEEEKKEAEELRKGKVDPFLESNEPEEEEGEEETSESRQKKAKVKKLKEKREKKAERDKKKKEKRQVLEKPVGMSQEEYDRLNKKEEYFGGLTKFGKYAKVGEESTSKLVGGDFTPNTSEVLSDETAKELSALMEEVTRDNKFKSPMSQREQVNRLRGHFGDVSDQLKDGTLMLHELKLRKAGEDRKIGLKKAGGIGGSGKYSKGEAASGVAQTKLSMLERAQILKEEILKERSSVLAKVERSRSWERKRLRNFRLQQELMVERGFKFGSQWKKEVHMPQRNKDGKRKTAEEIKGDYLKVFGSYKKVVFKPEKYPEGKGELLPDVAEQVSNAFDMMNIKVDKDKTSFTYPEILSGKGFDRVTDLWYLYDNSLETPIAKEKVMEGTSVERDEKEVVASNKQELSKNPVVDKFRGVRMDEEVRWDKMEEEFTKEITEQSTSGEFKLQSFLAMDKGDNNQEIGVVYPRSVEKKIGDDVGVLHGKGSKVKILLKGSVRCEVSGRRVEKESFIYVNLPEGMRVEPVFAEQGGLEHAYYGKKIFGPMLPLFKESAGNRILRKLGKRIVEYERLEYFGVNGHSFEHAMKQSFYKKKVRSEGIAKRGGVLQRTSSDANKVSNRRSDWYGSVLYKEMGMHRRKSRVGDAMSAARTQQEIGKNDVAERFHRGFRGVINAIQAHVVKKEQQTVMDRAAMSKYKDGFHKLAFSPWVDEFKEKAKFKYTATGQTYLVSSSVDFLGQQQDSKAEAIAAKNQELEEEDNELEESIKEKEAVGVLTKLDKIVLEAVKYEDEELFIGAGCSRGEQGNRFASGYRLQKGFLRRLDREEMDRVVGNLYPGAFLQSGNKVLLHQKRLEYYNLVVQNFHLVEKQIGFAMDEIKLDAQESRESVQQDGVYGREYGKKRSAGCEYVEEEEMLKVVVSSSYGYQFWTDHLVQENTSLVFDSMFEEEEAFKSDLAQYRPGVSFKDVFMQHKPLVEKKVSLDSQEEDQNQTESWRGSPRAMTVKMLTYDFMEKRRTSEVYTSPSQMTTILRLEIPRKNEGELVEQLDRLMYSLQPVWKDGKGLYIARSNVALPVLVEDKKEYVEQDAEFKVLEQIPLAGKKSYGCETLGSWEYWRED